jgi:peptide/nickel transport system permease protein
LASAPGGRREESVGAEFALFLVRRLVAGAFLLAAVVAATFLLISFAPGDTADVLAGESGADPAYLDLLRRHFHLDRPLAEQVGAYLFAVARGDLGFSAVQGQPVTDVIGSRLGASLLLGATALAVAALVGVSLGILAAVRRGGTLDALVSLLSLLAYSIPVFWLGQLLVALLAVNLHWLPAGGMRSAVGGSGVVDVIRHLVLPSLTLAALLLALIVRVTRAAMIEALQADYVTAARARGLSEARVVLRHALPNALRPTITVLTGDLGLVLTGAVLVETVFVWPGLGRLLYDSVLARDTPTLAGVLLLSAAVVFAANLLADIAYRLLDPRARFR